MNQGKVYALFVKCPSGVSPGSGGEQGKRRSAAQRSAAHGVAWTRAVRAQAPALWEIKPGQPILARQRFPSSCLPAHPACSCTGPPRRTCSTSRTPSAPSEVESAGREARQSAFPVHARGAPSPQPRWSRGCALPRLQRAGVPDNKPVLRAAALLSGDVLRAKVCKLCRGCRGHRLIFENCGSSGAVHEMYYIMLVVKRGSVAGVEIVPPGKRGLWRIPKRAAEMTGQSAPWVELPFNICRPLEALASAL